MLQSTLGFGIVGTLDLELVRSIAIRAEELGYYSLWVNDTPGGNSLERLEAGAQLTRELILGTGVIPVDRVTPRPTAEEINRRHLPVDRMLVGVGSSAAPSPLARISQAIDTLRESI